MDKETMAEIIAYLALNATQILEDFEKDTNAPYSKAVVRRILAAMALDYTKLLLLVRGETDRAYELTKEYDGVGVLQIVDEEGLAEYQGRVSEEERPPINDKTTPEKDDPTRWN